MGGKTSKDGMSPDHQPLVGDPVGLTPGISKGEFGEQEVVAPGQPCTYYEGSGLISGFQCNGWIWTCCQWPFSSTVFLTILVGQYCCAPWCYCCLGNAWCFKPSQIPYIHALYVVQQTLKDAWCGFLCCCGWAVSVSPGVLLATAMLSTPPKFLFDEDKDKPYLMGFEEYVKAKRWTFPPFSGRYRAIDGGGNHHEYTFVGQGKRGYAMNEPYMIYSVLPDAEKMMRDLQFRTTFKDCPFDQNAISCWFANVAIHDFFRSASGTDKQYTGGVEKPWVNLHSGYLDLQVLYGWNEEIAAGVRTFKDGHLDRIAETRFNGSRIPESKVIVEVLKLEHNYVCDQLKLKYPYQFTTDEALYQQARLIMGGVFINIILRQYGDQMFGESAPDGRGFAELRQQNYGWWPACIGDKQAVGNQPTLSFNLIYRWHTAVPQEWSAAKTPPINTKEEMRKVLEDNYVWKSGGFGPNNMPDALFMRQISVPAAAVNQGRLCGAPRLNDFRRRFASGYKDFEDMCGDPEVAMKVAQWYPTVEDVELAVGVQVERSMAGGWGLGQTVGLAILADAFSSIRQDRFYTTDFTPKVYTDWGYEHAKTTILTDILDRHLGMILDRNVMLGRVPTWEGPPQWTMMDGWPCPLKSFTARGWPKVKK